MEAEIEHGLATISDQESRQRSGTGSSSGDPPGSVSADIATTSLAALGTVPGTAAPQLATQAKTIEDSLPRLADAEKAIQARNGIMTLFFGGDKTSAASIDAMVAVDQAALDSMDAIISDPSTSPALKTFTQQREATIRAELERLKGVSAAEKQKKGLFG